MEGTQASGATRFSCPPNFTEMPPASDPPRFSLEMLAGPDTELWLIQAPADFAPHCLNGRRVPLSGSRIVKGKVEGKRHRYQVLSCSGPPAGGATLLAPSAEAGGGLTCAPAARGSLRIIEGPQESPGTPLQAIPACPPPQIPAGLRPRFCAFGGSPPVTGPASAVGLRSPSPGKRRKKKRRTPEASATPEQWVNGHQPVEADTAWGCLDTEVRKKTKKIKKQLGDSGVTEPGAMEQAAEMPEPLDQPLSPTASSKKKKPKGTEMSEPGLGMLEPEGKPGGPPVGTVLSPTKKRKREKGAEGIEAAEGTAAGSQPQTDVGLQGEAIAPSPRKKRRDKRGDSVVELRTGMGLHGETTEPELWRECGLQAEADLVPPKKKKKRESVTVAPGPGVMEAGLPTDLAWEAPAPSKDKKKKKREKRQKETEPGAEEMSQRRPQEPEESPHQGSSKKRKKREQEGGAPGPAP